MRFSAIIVALLLAIAVGASPLQRQVPIWEKRAAQLGLTEARVVLEYSITDKCELGAIRLTEASSKELFDPETVAEIAKVYVGPFEGANRDVVDEINSDGTDATRLSTLIRFFTWTTKSEAGRIVCTFNLDGSLANPSLHGVIWQSEQKTSFHPITVRLSELGKSSQEISFEVRE